MNYRQRENARENAERDSTSVILDQMLSPENMYVQIICEPGRPNFYI